MVPASGNVKAGTTCKKLGQTSTSSGYKYTCVNSGKKLVWNKGVKIPVIKLYEIPELPTPKVLATSSSSFSVEIAPIDGFDFSKVFLYLHLTEGFGGDCASKIIVSALPFRTLCTGVNKTSIAIYLSAVGKLGETYSPFKFSEIATVLLSPTLTPTPKPTPSVSATPTAAPTSTLSPLAKSNTWVLGQTISEYSCRPLEPGQIPQLQIKQNEVWYTKAFATVSVNVSLCGNLTRLVTYNYKVDVTGDAKTLGTISGYPRATELAVREYIPKSTKDNEFYSPPTQKTSYASQSLLSQDFLDFLNSGLGTSSSAGSKFQNCTYKGKKLFGAVYLTKYAFDADIKAYVTNYSFDADLDVYRTPYSFDANSCGEWYLTPYSSDANLKVYLTSYSFEADIKIYYTNYSFDAGLNR